MVASLSIADGGPAPLRRIAITPGYRSGRHDASPLGIQSRRGGSPTPPPRLLARLVALLRRWRRRSYERRLLARLGERERRDLGLTRTDIQREVAKPFWRG